MIEFFNPTVSKFIEKQDPTLIGLMWAMMWRWYAAIFFVAVVIAGLGKIFE